MDFNDFTRTVNSVMVGYGVLAHQLKALESKVAELDACGPATCPASRAAAASVVAVGGEMINTLRSIIAFAASTSD